MTFNVACKMVGIEDTKRQKRKWEQRRGLAWLQHSGQLGLSEVDVEDVNNDDRRALADRRANACEGYRVSC